MKTHALPLAATLLCLSLAACAPTTEDRSGRLLTLAAEEAKNIPGSLDRFTRQLNIANTQINTFRLTDADKTLQLAAQTLTAGKTDDFDDFHRIAGWTSISELAWAAQDHAMAKDALQKALDALNTVKPVWNRAQYVDSLATELDVMRGHPDAVELLTTGAGWAAQIDDRNTRRLALFIFANHLISLDAYDPARAVLEREPDAAWRTDALLALADRYTVEPAVVLSSGMDMAAGMNLRNPAPGAGGGGGFGGAGRGGQAPATFGKDVRFESVFKQSQ